MMKNTNDDGAELTGQTIPDTAESKPRLNVAALRSVLATHGINTGRIPDADLRAAIDALIDAVRAERLVFDLPLIACPFCHVWTGYPVEVIAHVKARHVEQPSWQKIETAPKDGHVLLWCADDYGCNIGYWEGAEWEWPGKATSSAPTFWQPLPPAPPSQEIP